MAKSKTSKVQASVSARYLAGESYGEIAEALAKETSATVTADDVRKLLGHPDGCRAATTEIQLQRQRDEIASLKKKVTQGHRAEALYQALAETITEHAHPIEPPKSDIRKPTGKKIHKEDLVLLLSDLHADQMTTAGEVGGVEEYNFNVCAARIERLVDTLLDFTQGNLSNYRFGTLHVFLNGDLVNGLIHRGAEYGAFRNALKGAMRTGDLLALALSDLSRHFPRIDVVGVPGNHGRITMHTNEADAHESLDYVCMETARRLLEKHSNIHWNLPHSYSHTKQIGPWWFHVTHGDQIKGGFAGIPFYGVARKAQRKQSLHSAFGKNLDVFLFGHFHNSMYQANHRGGWFINGAIPATSAFGYNRIDAAGEPAQWMFGTCERFATTWKLDIKPKRSPEQERAVRYLLKYED